MPIQWVLYYMLVPLASERASFGDILWVARWRGSIDGGLALLSEGLRWIEAGVDHCG